MLMIVIVAPVNKQTNRDKLQNFLKICTLTINISGTKYFSIVCWINNKIIKNCKVT